MMTTVYHLESDLPYSSFTLIGDNAFAREVVESVLSAKPIPSWRELPIEVMERGRKGLGDLAYLDSLPVLTPRAAESLRDLLVPNGQLLPVRHGQNSWFLLNVTRVIDALDVGKSRLDYEGDISPGDKHVFRQEALEGVAVFKVPQSLRVGFPYVTDEFVARVKQEQLTGFLFTLVWPRQARREPKLPQAMLPWLELQAALKVKHKLDGVSPLLLTRSATTRTNGALTKLEQKLKRRMPGPYKKAWRAYRLEAWDGIADYWQPASIWKVNFKPPYPWWGDSERPEHLLMVAQTDPYTILLDIKTGQVFAMDEETPLDKVLPVASDFEKFVQGLGNLEVFMREGKSNSTLAKSIAKWVGGRKGQEFWLEHAALR